MNAITRLIGAAKLATKANAPTIMVVTGIVAMGAAAVFASKKTLDLEEVIDPHVRDLETIKTVEGEVAPSSEIAQAALKDKTRVYGRLGFDVAKLYAVPTGLFVSGAVLVLAGHQVLLRRNATLAVAFTGLSNAFQRYRENVVKTYGEQIDSAMVNGGYEVEFDKKGETATVHPKAIEDGVSLNDPYSRIFEEGATSEWQDDTYSNRVFLDSQQRFAQQLLNRQGYLYLSEVYKALGFPESDTSRVVGWKVRMLPDGTKDIPVVSFGLDQPIPDEWRENRSRVLLDFNCQGLIVGGRVQKILEKVA